MKETIKRELEEFGFSDSEARQFWGGAKQNPEANHRCPDRPKEVSR